MGAKEEMLRAKELIKSKQYNEARKILKGIDHPKAREWEAKLPTLPKPKRNYLRIALILVIVAGLVFAAIQYAEIRRQAAFINDMAEGKIITDQGKSPCNYNPGGQC